jgi:hypothetical protein
MKTDYTVPENKNPLRSLYQLVDNNVKNYLAIAKRNSNSFINNVNDKLWFNGNEAILNSVIGGVLNALVTHVRESHIQISAKELYGKMIEVNVKDDNCYNTYAVALSLQDIVPLAEKIGGRIDITNQRQKITTVSFRFPLANGQELSL